MPAHTDLMWPSNDSRLMRHAQRSMPLSTALMHPAANFLPSTPVPCNKDRTINQAEIADTRHWLMKWGTLELMTNGSLRYGHSIRWRSAENTWPLKESWSTFRQSLIGGYANRCCFKESAGTVWELLGRTESWAPWPTPAFPRAHTKALGVTFRRPVVLLIGVSAKQSHPTQHWRRHWGERRGRDSRSLCCLHRGEMDGKKDFEGKNLD